MFWPPPKPPLLYSVCGDCGYSSWSDSDTYNHDCPTPGRYAAEQMRIRAERAVDEAWELRDQ